jgi:hypothetical protein
VAKFDVVVEPVFHGRTGRKLGLRPNAEDGCSQHMSAGVAYALQFGHFIPLVERFAFWLLVIVRLHISFGFRAYPATKKPR